MQHKQQIFYRSAPWVLLVALLATAGDADWPQYRGARGDGISAGTNLAETWPEEGPKEVWRIPFGPGYSETTLHQGVIYTTLGAGEEGAAQEYAAAFEAKSGKELWRTAVDDLLTTEFGDGSRATPAIGDGMMFTLSGNGKLVVLNTSDGKVIWQKDLVAEYKSRKPQWGFSTSPVIEGDTLILQVGGAEGQMMGFNKNTGEQLWQALKGPSSYSTPTQLSLHGQRQLVFTTGGKVVSLDPKGGELWRFEYGKYPTIAMPLFLPPNQFLLSSSDEGLAVMMKVDRDGETYKTEEVWRNQSFRNHWSSSLLRQGFIYGFDNATFKCIDGATGKHTWAKRGFGKGAMVMGGNKIFLLTDRGQLVYFLADSSAYQQKGKVQALKGRCWTAPVLADGRLYLRNHDEMVCYDLRASK